MPVPVKMTREKNEYKFWRINRQDRTGCGRHDLRARMFRGGQQQYYYYLRTHASRDCAYNNYIEFGARIL